MLLEGTHNNSPHPVLSSLSFSPNPVESSTCSTHAIRCGDYSRIWNPGLLYSSSLHAPKANTTQIILPSLVSP